MEVMTQHEPQQRPDPYRGPVAEFKGRLCEFPLWKPHPLPTDIPELRAAAPTALIARAARSPREWTERLWEEILDPRRLGCVAVRRVPVWIPGPQVGYVLDFLLPEYSVNVQIDRWEAHFDDDEADNFDFRAQPDHPFNDDRDGDLLDLHGIVVVHLWDLAVANDGVAAACREIRLELGIDRPQPVESGRLLGHDATSGSGP